MREDFFFALKMMPRPASVLRSDMDLAERNEESRGTEISAQVLGPWGKMLLFIVHLLANSAFN